MEIIRPQANITSGQQPPASVDNAAAKLASATTPAQSPVAARAEAAGPEVLDLESVVAEISSYVQDKQRSLHFRVSDSGPAIIEVYDRVTEELIREIPSKEAQRIAEIMREQLDSGLMLKLEV